MPHPRCRLRIASMAASAPARTSCSSSSSTTSRSSALAPATLEQVVAPESFPVFQEDTTEGSPSPPTPPPSSRPRRRSRQVTNLDRALFFGLPKAKVVNYVDIVKCLRAPPFRAPNYQSGRQTAYVPTSTSPFLTTISHPSCPFEPAPWARSKSPSPAQRASSAQRDPMSGSKQPKTASTSQNTT